MKIIPVGSVDTVHPPEKYFGAGAIDEGQAVAHEVDRGDGRLDTHRMGFCFGGMIGDSIAGRNGILAGDGACSGEDCFKKGGFSAGEGTDDGDAFRSRTSSSGAISHGD